MADDRRRLAEAFGPDCMLIIDEAQYLVKQNQKGRDDWEAFVWLRGMAEEAFMSVVFCGDLRLRELAQVAEPLWRRMRRCIITGTAREDVEAVAAQWGTVDQKARDMLFAVARKSGGALASAVAVCREAQIMAGGLAISLLSLLPLIWSTMACGMSIGLGMASVSPVT